MSNQTFIKKDRISFAKNLNEKYVIAPNSNTVFIGPNSSILYDTNSNVTSINTSQGVTFSNQYIYADGTYIRNLAPGNISGWAYFPAKSNVDMSGNNILNANEIYSAEVRTTNVLTDSLYAPNGVGNINVRNTINMNTNIICNTGGIETSYVSIDTLYGLTNPNITVYGNFNMNSFAISNTGDIIPATDLTYNLGSSSFRWGNIFVSTITFADSTIQNTAGGGGGSASNWSHYPAISTVDFSNNIIENVNTLQLATSYPYYANMNLTYTFDTFLDPMNGYTGTYEILNIDNQPFSLYNANNGLFTLPNLYSLVFLSHKTNIYLYNNSNDNHRFYYNDTLSNRAIAQDWFFYKAESNVDLSGNGIQNISSIGFYDSNVPTSNTSIRYQSSLLYYNNSNEIIGGTLQYLPQLISFAPFSPSQIPYLGLWLDAADFNTFILDSGYIVQWNDKSSNSNYFIPTNPPPLYTGPSVIFDGTFLMTSSNVLTFDTNTYIFLVDSINSTSFEMAFVLNDINGGDYSLRYVSDGFHNADAGDALWPRYYANGYLNGTVDFTQTHIIDGVFNSSGTSIMRLSSDFMGRVFLGNMNEVIVYNGPTPLTSNQIAQVRTYLTAKWSIPAFNPTQIPNLALWLDGKDPNSFTISGGNILQWYDKSPNSNTFTPSYGDTAYLNGAVFTGTSILTSLASLTYDTNTYVFMVASLVVTGTGDLVRMSFATNGDYSMRYYSSYYAALGGGADILTTYNVNGTPFGTIDFTQTHIIDGAFSSSGASVMQLSSAVNGRFFTGSINEIIVYNGLTNDQIIQVRNYLANKWNITL